MKYLAPYRLATYLLVFFAIAHTAGGMFGQRAEGGQAEAVFHAMKAVKFPMMGATCSWYGYWLGFGLMVTAFLLFSAVLTWNLAGLTRAQRQPLAPLTWALCATFVASAVIGWAYFFAPPAVTSTLIAILVGLESVRDARAAR
ncbi:MAG TPA: hypothetical protein VIA18_11345 [Polyangia bacterium]|jgi:hypothetical protein|nr:hypothetical protein [Polyangia bacterium]